VIGAAPVALTENVAVWPAITLLLTGCAVMDGGAFTVKVAALLVTLPEPLVTATVNVAPLSEAAAAGVVYVAEVAPPIDAPFFFHWYVNVPEPVADTLKVAVCPTATVLLTGCVEMVGGTLTVRTAALLVMLPVPFVTVTVNCAPLSDATVAGVV
jgi:hypothetical protein